MKSRAVGHTVPLMDPAPRVRCRACDFAWYGETAADGLRIVGACTKCGGELAFADADADADAAAEAAEPSKRREAEVLAGVSPAAVLGMPTTWAR